MAQQYSETAISEGKDVPSEGKTAAQIARIHFDRTREVISPVVVGIAAKKIRAEFIEVDEGGDWGPRKYFTDAESILTVLRERLEAQQPEKRKSGIMPETALTSTAIAELFTLRIGKEMTYQTVNAVAREIASPSAKIWDATLERSVLLYKEPEAIISALTAMESQAEERQEKSAQGWKTEFALENVLPADLRRLIIRSGCYGVMPEIAAKLNFVPIHGYYDPAWWQLIFEKLVDRVGGTAAHKKLNIVALMEADERQKQVDAARWQAQRDEIERRTITPFPEDFDADYGDTDFAGKTALCCAIAYNSKWRVVLAWAYDYSGNDNQYFIDIEGAKGVRSSLVLTGDFEYQDFMSHVANFVATYKDQDGLTRRGDFLSLRFKSNRLRIMHSDQEFFIANDSRVLLHRGGPVDFKNDLTYLDIDLDALPLLAEVAAFQADENGLVLMASLPGEGWFVPGNIGYDTGAKAAHYARRLDRQRDSHASAARKAIIGRLAAVNDAISQYKKR